MIRNLLLFTAPLFMLFRTADKESTGTSPISRERQPAPIAPGADERAAEAAKLTLAQQDERNLRSQLAETDSAVTDPGHVGKAPAAQPPSSVVQNPQSQAAAAFRVNTAVAAGALPNPNDDGKFELPPNANGPAVAHDLTTGGQGAGAGVTTDTGIQTGGPVIGDGAATGGEGNGLSTGDDVQTLVDENTSEELVALAEKEEVTVGSHDDKPTIAKAIVAKRAGK